MVKVAHSIHINAPITKVWAVARDFANVTWLEGATAPAAPLDGPISNAVGVVRDLPLAPTPQGPLKVCERLLSLDDRNHSFSYCMTETSLPLANYYAVFRAFPNLDADGTFIVWEAEWDAAGAPDEVGKGIILEGVFKPSLRNLKRAMEA